MEVNFTSLLIININCNITELKKKSSRKGKLNFMSDIDLLAPLVTLLYYVNQTQTIRSLYCFKKKKSYCGPEVVASVPNLL